MNGGLVVTICVGSSCNLRGSDELAVRLQRLIDKEGLDTRVELVGAFCMDRCSQGISVRVGERVFGGIRLEEGEAFFYREIIGDAKNQVPAAGGPGGAAEG